MKTFKGPGGFQKIMSLILSVVMGVGMSVYALWMAQNMPGNELAPIFTPTGLLISSITGFAVGYVICDIVPAADWGNRLSARISNALLRLLVSTLVTTLVYVTLITFVMIIVSNLAMVPFVGCVMMWVSLLPGFLLLGYILLLIFTPIAMFVGKAGSGFDPAAASPEIPREL